MRETYRNEKAYYFKKRMITSEEAIELEKKGGDILIESEYDYNGQKITREAAAELMKKNGKIKISKKDNKYKWIPREEFKCYKCGNNDKDVDFSHFMLKHWRDNLSEYQSEKHTNQKYDSDRYWHQVRINELQLNDNQVWDKIKPEPLSLFNMNTRMHPLLCICLLYTSPSPRDGLLSRMPSSA